MSQNLTLNPLQIRERCHEDSKDDRDFDQANDEERQELVVH
jgi:hypothetical protein